MRRVRVVHWRDAESGPILAACRAGGFAVEYDSYREVGDSVRIIREIRANIPDAVVIDLSRLPSHGREFAFAIRTRKYTRHVPIVFVEGDAEKTAAIRAQIPDATYTTLKRLAASVEKACRKKTVDAVKPPTVSERYGARTIAQKLGIKAGSSVGLFDAPRDYAAVIGTLPEGVELIEDPEAACPVTLWFVRDPRGYRSALRRMRAIAPNTKLWVIWPKGADNGINSNSVREFAIDYGLVDYKICALGAPWSGMVFAVRKSSVPQ